MCLAIPGKIKNITKDLRYAQVDFNGVVNKVNVELVKPKVNDWVIVHAGFAIQILTEKDAQDTLKLYKQMLQKDGRNNKKN